MTSPPPSELDRDRSQPYYATGQYLRAKHTLIRALARLGISYQREATSPFNLDNGAAILGNSFGHIERHEFVDEQIYPSAEAFTQSYLTIGSYRSLIARADIEEEKKAALPHLFCELAAQVADEQGAIHVPILMGAFICTKAR